MARFYVQLFRIRRLSIVGFVRCDANQSMRLINENAFISSKKAQFLASKALSFPASRLIVALTPQLSNLKLSNYRF